MDSGRDARTIDADITSFSLLNRYKQVLILAWLQGKDISVSEILVSEHRLEFR